MKFALLQEQEHKRLQTGYVKRSTKDGMCEHALGLNVLQTGRHVLAVTCRTGFVSYEKGRQLKGTCSCRTLSNAFLE